MQHISGDRLRAYEKNNFESEPVLLPTPLEVSWPSKGFQQLTEGHRGIIPKQIDTYFVHRLAGRLFNSDCVNKIYNEITKGCKFCYIILPFLLSGNKQCSGDVKTIEKRSKLGGN